MYFLALACDYDGTIANYGFVNAGTVDAMKRFKVTGRRLILLTGRQIPDLTHAFEPRQAHNRHTGKYAVGDIGERESFYFRGPRNALNLRAPNLLRFLQIAEEVDDATWQHHLRAKNYSACSDR